ncbi:hypothetical protein AVEN_156959-1 [Araneus ventricosus]|uniref:Uncharacterized protein n=1 Tax=Araneus ventricosus TaxID=182803 RepID=A0A4Y2SSS6_ARAVE|nr:hypothetical protein AVEN_156959-1 [Araneus ventricosus]
MFNTEQRKNSKLMNNSVNGKTMENIRNRIDVQLMNDEKKAQKLVAATAEPPPPHSLNVVNKIKYFLVVFVDVSGPSFTPGNHYFQTQSPTAYRP